MSRWSERARGPVILRLAREEDREALRRLAELDSSTVPRAPVMVAEARGEVLAAVSTLDGATVADPFAPTAALVELLRVRVLQLRAEDRSPLSASRGRRSLAALAARLVGPLGGAGERRPRPTG